MIRLLMAQVYRNIRKPWFVLVLVATFVLTVWLAVSPFRDQYSYQGFMNRYGDMSPSTVSRFVLGEARPDLTVSDIYDVYMFAHKEEHLRQGYLSTARGLAFIGCVIPAFFVGRELGKRKIRAVLIPGQSRAAVFIWIVVRYFLAAFILITASLGMVRVQWSVEPGQFEHFYMVNTQLRFVLYCLSVFSAMMFVTFIIKNPIPSAIASLVVAAIAFLTGKLFPVVSPVSELFMENYWYAETGPEFWRPHVIASFIIIAVFIAASWLIFRRREV